MPSLAGFVLVVAGLLNFLVGFLALLPALLQLAMSTEPADATTSVDFETLLTTSYGRYALAHLLGGCLQCAGGSYAALLALGRGPWTHSFLALALVSLGLEAGGWWFKGSLTPLAAPGVVAAALCTFVYASIWRARPGAGVRSVVRSA